MDRCFALACQASTSLVTPERDDIDKSTRPMSLIQMDVRSRRSTLPDGAPSRRTSETASVSSPPPEGHAHCSRNAPFAIVSSNSG